MASTALTHPAARAARLTFVFALVVQVITLSSGVNAMDHAAASVAGGRLTQGMDQAHQSLFVPGPPFNVGEVVYPSAHDFDTSPNTDTCLSLSVPAGDTFTLSLEWEALVEGRPGAGDLDLYIYLDSACTESALLTSSFNSNAYTGELLEITPKVRNIGSETAVAGVRIGRRSGRGNPGMLRLTVLTGEATFLEHGTDGPPLEGSTNAPTFDFSGPFSVPENALPGASVGFVTALDPQSDPLIFFELEPASGQTTFEINAYTGEITVEDPAALDRETAAALGYWIGVTDGTSASLVNVSIMLTGVNDNVPVAMPTSAHTAPGVSVSISLSGTDADIDPADHLTMNIASYPANGTLNALTPLDKTTSTAIYTPAPGFIGTDTFTFEASDGVSVSVPAAVTVTVSDAPPPPPTPTPGAFPTATITPAPGAPSPTPSPDAGINPGPGGGGFTPSASPTPSAQHPAVSPPSAPRFLQAEPGDSSVTITWQRPLSDGGEAIAGYRIFNINNAQSTLIHGDVNEGTVHALSNGANYLFQVRAFNSAGFGEPALVGPVTPGHAGPHVLDVQASVHPDDSVTVWWRAPEEDRQQVAEYRVWLEGGELLRTVLTTEPLIVNITELQADTWHTFRVSASSAEGELVATGVTGPVYLPSTLASAYGPPPDDAVLVSLTEQTRAELQLVLRSVAGGEGTVPDLPAVLTVRDGQTDIFFHVEGLYRGLVLPDEFAVNSGQLMIDGAAADGHSFQLEIADNVTLAGGAESLVDPTGVLFKLIRAEIRLRAEFEQEGVPVSRVEVTYRPSALSGNFAVAAELPSQLPLPVGEVLGNPAIGDVAGVVAISSAGMRVNGHEAEGVRFTVSRQWHGSQPDNGLALAIYRVAGQGVVDTTPVTCEADGDADTVTCVGVFANHGGGTVYYALTAASDMPQTEPDQQPTPVSAPATPTPASGPSLVVVEETPTSSSTAHNAPVDVPVFSATATPRPAQEPPIVPESGEGGASVVTWLMAGILGLVVVRGAFYAVGRIKS